MSIEDDPILCYVDGRAYFTTRPLSEQWGDDWNDAPYEHNAGSPYAPSWIDCKDGKKWAIHSVLFCSELVTPVYEQFNSPYSVQSINNREIPWLRTNPEDFADHPVNIWAGTPLSEFRRIIEETGGCVSARVNVSYGAWDDPQYAAMAPAE